MNQIAASSMLPQISQADRTALVDACNSFVGEEITRPLALSVRERLQRFLASTAGPAEERAAAGQIEAEIGLLTFSFTSARVVSKDEAQIRVHEYTGVLEGFPLWAIREGFRRIKHGELEGVSLDFPPSAPRLKSVVTDVMRPLLADRYEVKCILDARVAPLENPDAAERAKRLAFIKSFGPTPSHGIGGTPVNEIGRSDKPVKPISEAMSRKDVLAHYETHNLGFTSKARPREDRDNGSEGGAAA